ncbi:UDP-N-acetylmuramoylalanyl-D-glutamyl-2,6-diaminopimelate--D-alanyl-D-alanine ligase [Methylovirgula sp. 4M-Z18]|uniref:UDP-N-acetylmuramoylalanyl-D-glutamyl-2, 6-diaminopimelate--D-alanyl-D-alanine ligase n=2 Tax=Methylovirgula sp. 4M-Z18 TaxID=2293567 RepID=UPI0032AFA62F
MAKQVLESAKGLDKPQVWSGLGLVAPLRARVSGGMPVQVSGVSIDTRTLEQGDLFVAIKGEASDGHDYVAAAFDKGAAAAVVDEAHVDQVKGHGPLYIVHEVLPALERLGRAARQRSKARIIAVTGSVGKTTTKEALREVLSSFAPTHASVASYNNHWGVPLTLARMPASARFGVLEIGMNHAGEITPLVDMVRPHVAIVTTVAPVHLEYFSSVEAIAEAKAEIFSGIAKGGLAILPRDVAQYDVLREKAKASPAGHIITFGEHEEADARLLSSTVRDDGTLVEASILGQRLSYVIGAPGKHMAMNSLAVLVAARAVGADLRTATQALARFAPQSGRGARVTLHLPEGEAILIDESYNANPVSMRAALSLLGQSQPHDQGRRIAVIGDMLELGDNAPELHRNLIGDLEANSVDLLFGAGPLTHHLFEAAPEHMRGHWAERSADIEDALRNVVRAGDVIMVKGSNGSRMGPVVAALKTHFADTQTDQN